MSTCYPTRTTCRSPATSPFTTARRASTCQFAPVKASLKALTRWALRFGAVLTSEPHEGKHGPETWCYAKFDYYGLAVTAYAHIPAEPAAT